MKPLIIFFQWVIIILIVLHFFVWFIAYGSGHNVSDEIDRNFIRNIIILLFILIILLYFKNRINKI
jgi:hypothetical protein